MACGDSRSAWDLALRGAQKAVGVPRSSAAPGLRSPRTGYHHGWQHRLLAAFGCDHGFGLLPMSLAVAFRLAFALPEQVGFDAHALVEISHSGLLMRASDRPEARKQP